MISDIDTLVDGLVDQWKTEDPKAPQKAAMIFITGGSLGLEMASNKIAESLIQEEWDKGERAGFFFPTAEDKLLLSDDLKERLSSAIYTISWRQTLTL